jgi:hypothetical protein
MKIFKYTLNTYVYYIHGLIFMNLITWMSHCALCMSKRRTVNSRHRACMGNDGLLPESRGVRCYSVRGGDGAAGQRSFFACQRVLAQQ